MHDDWQSNVHNAAEAGTAIEKKRLTGSNGAMESLTCRQRSMHHCKRILRIKKVYVLAPKLVVDWTSALVTMPYKDLGQ